MKVSEAKAILASKGFTFLRTEVKKWRYDYNTTYRQGDYGVASQRVYIFLDDQEEEVSMSTCSLKGIASTILMNSRIEQRVNA